MKIQMPKGACDTHMHFYDTKFPGAPGTFLPGNFTVPQYRELQKKLGLERVIVVQPNAYADDNTVTVNAMKELGKGAKGVAVVKPDVKEAELERLTKAGICAVRIMTLHGAMLGFDVMDAVMKRVHPHGWHPNIQLEAAICRSTRRRSSACPASSSSTTPASSSSRWRRTMRRFAAC